MRKVNYHKDLNFGDKLFGAGIVFMNRDKITKKRR